MGKLYPAHLHLLVTFVKIVNAFFLSGVENIEEHEFINVLVIQ